MTKNKKLKIYNDGVCLIVDEIKTPSSFAARQNGTKFSDYSTVYRLMFEEMSIREQDITFAESISRTVSRKIKTHLVKNVNARQKIIIENTVYDIINYDADRKNSEMYFYLEEARKLDGET